MSSAYKANQTYCRILDRHVIDVISVVSSSRWELVSKAATAVSHIFCKWSGNASVTPIIFWSRRRWSFFVRQENGLKQWWARALRMMIQVKIQNFPAIQTNILILWMGWLSSADYFTGPSISTLRLGETHKWWEAFLRFCGRRWLDWVRRRVIQ